MLQLFNGRMIRWSELVHLVKSPNLISCVIPCKLKASSVYIKYMTWQVTVIPLS